MTRFALIAALLAGLAVSITGCTNTVRGFGKDINSNTVQDYNSRTATNLDY